MLARGISNYLPKQVDAWRRGERGSKEHRSFSHVSARENGSRLQIRRGEDLRDADARHSRDALPHVRRGSSTKRGQPIGSRAVTQYGAVAHPTRWPIRKRRFLDMPRRTRGSASLPATRASPCLYRCLTRPRNVVRFIAQHTLIRTGDFMILLTTLILSFLMMQHRFFFL
jgi:hypothetical protein